MKRGFCLIAILIVVFSAANLAVADSLADRFKSAFGEEPSTGAASSPKVPLPLLRPDGEATVKAPDKPISPIKTLGGGVGQQKTFEFRGHIPGESIDKNFPYWSLGYRGLKLPYCSQKELPKLYYCDDETVNVKLDYGLEQKQIGGVPIDLLYYSFFKGRLFGVDMAFKVINFSKILDMLDGRYGKADEIKSGSVQNRLGATFDNVEAEWHFREGVLKLTMRYTDINTSWLQFVDGKIAAAVDQDIKAAGKKRGKDAF